MSFELQSSTDFKPDRAGCFSKLFCTLFFQTTFSVVLKNSIATCSFESVEDCSKDKNFKVNFFFCGILNKISEIFKMN